MIELKVNKHEVTVTDADGTLGELIEDVADIIRYFYLSQEKAGWGADTFRKRLLDYLVNEGGDANADEAWAWQPQKGELLWLNVRGLDARCNTDIKSKNATEQIVRIERNL